MSYLDSRIRQIMSRTTCEKHAAGLDEPCWELHINTLPIRSPALCGIRVRAAGYVGPTQPTELSPKEKAIRGSWAAPRSRV